MERAFLSARMLKLDWADQLQCLTSFGYAYWCEEPDSLVDIYRLASLNPLENPLSMLSTIGTVL